MKRSPTLFAAVLLSSASLLGQSPAPSVPLTRVAYVMMGVADVGRAVDFYHGKLGLTIKNQVDDLAFIDAGSISIVVSSEVGRQPGNSEIVFPVEHVTQAVEALRSRGIRIDVPSHPLTATNWAASFKDPDGHVLSIYGPQ